MSDIPTCTVPLPAPVAGLLARISAGLDPAPGTSGVVLIAVNTGQDIVTALRPTPADLAVPGALAPAVAVLTTADVAGVSVAGFGPADPVEDAVAATVDALSAGTVPVTHCVRVADGRWWPLPPTATTPAAGTGIPLDPAGAAPDADGEPAAAALSALLTPVAGARRDRVDLATLMATLGMTRIAGADGGVLGRLLRDPELAAAADRVLGKLDVWSPDDIVAAVPAWLNEIEYQYRAGSTVDDQTVALLSVVLLPEVLPIVVQRALGSPWELRMWSDVARRAAPSFTGRPAAVLALCAKYAGHRTLARAAADQAITADPGDPPPWPN